MYTTFYAGVRGWASYQIFKKVEGLDRISIFRGEFLIKRVVTFFRGGCIFYTKNKLKYEILNYKKTQIYRGELPKKEGLESLQMYMGKGGEVGKKEEVVLFLRKVVDTPVYIMMIKTFCQFSQKCLLKYFVPRFVDKSL